MLRVYVRISKKTTMMKRCAAWGVFARLVLQSWKWVQQNASRNQVPAANLVPSKRSLHVAEQLPCFHAPVPDKHHEISSLLQ